jgi:hypothetical protein
MLTFTDLKGEDLHWVQPSLMSPVYELRTMTGEVVARISRTGLINQIDEVEAAGGHYRIHHKGILNRWFDIHRVTDDGETPEYQFHHESAELVLPDEHRIHWRKMSQKPIRWAWMREDTTMPLLQLTCPGDKATAQIHLELGSADPGTRLLLALLGAYLVLLYSDELE